MVRKRAKILAAEHIDALLLFARHTRQPTRNRVLVLLSVKAGLRAGEIAKLTWAMIADATGDISNSLELHDAAAKKLGGRVIPIHRELHAALVELVRQTDSVVGPVIRSERGGPMMPVSIVCWFSQAYAAVGLEGCSSHSGRRTFITRAARLVHKAGGSLRDVQLLAGHRSLQTTQGYIDGDTDIQRKLVSMV